MCEDTDCALMTKLKKERRAEDNVHHTTNSGWQNIISHSLQTGLHCQTAPNGESAKLNVERE